MFGTAINGGAGRGRWWLLLRFGIRTVDPGPSKDLRQSNSCQFPIRNEDYGGT